MASKHTVYILKTLATPPRYYTGVTSNIDDRVAAHNAGRCEHTSKSRPWAVDVAITFSDEKRALALERYLKTGSGQAFAVRHLRS